MNTLAAFTNFFLFVCLLASVFALPLQTRDVYAPPILYPTEGTVWKVGDNQTVKWSVSLSIRVGRMLIIGHRNVTDPPTQITNPIGDIFLRKGDTTLPGMYPFCNIPQVAHPRTVTLASNFSILLGSIQVQVPDVPEGDDYMLVREYCHNFQSCLGT
jgi:hypothetical protein